MKLKEALKDITRIPDASEEDNLENYLRSVNYISNLYKFHTLLNNLVPTDEIEYLPTFKDCYISQRLGIGTITEENELRLISIKSPLFRVDKTVEEITAAFDEICNVIDHHDDIITFYLK